MPTIWCAGGRYVATVRRWLLQITAFLAAMLVLAFGNPNYVGTSYYTMMPVIRYV